METHLRNNQLDRDYNAARWCADEAASDRIFVAANSQDHLAEAYLGILFEKGCKAFPIDRSSSMLYSSRAIAHLTSKSNRGDPNVVFLLGFCLCDGRSITRNEAEAVKCYQIAADKGHAGAQYNLGICFANGIGTPRNEEAAAHYYHLAAEQGHCAAQNNLGYCYEIGNGAPKRTISSTSSQEDQVWEEYPSPVTMFFSCCIAGVRRHDEDGAQYHQLASENDNVNIESAYGAQQRNGIGIPANPHEAFQYYSQAAKQGHAAALYNLGRCHKDGIGVPINVQEAARYFRLAADHGLAEAQYLLGYNLINGIHVGKNVREGIIYYQAAAEQGHKGAQTALEVIESKKGGLFGWFW